MEIDFSPRNLSIRMMQCELNGWNIPQELGFGGVEQTFCGNISRMVRGELASIGDDHPEVRIAVQMYVAGAIRAINVLCGGYDEWIALAQLKMIVSDGRSLAEINELRERSGWPLLTEENVADFIASPTMDRPPPITDDEAVALAVAKADEMIRSLS